MAKMKLHVFPPSPNARQVLIAANELNSDVEICMVDLLKQQQKTPEFLALNPNGLMPVLEDGDFVLWESTAIMQYLGTKETPRTLWPADAQAQADVSRWQSWRLAHWGSACGAFTFENMVKQLVGGGDPDPAELAKGQVGIEKYGSILNNHLQGRKFLVGDTMTLADISVGSWLTFYKEAKIPVEGFAEIIRWRESLEAMDSWKTAAPSFG